MSHLCPAKTDQQAPPIKLSVLSQGAFVFATYPNGVMCLFYLKYDMHDWWGKT
jgi:hypothetical protein